jgi:hypothetical protein
MKVFNMTNSVKNEGKTASKPIKKAPEIDLGAEMAKMLPLALRTMRRVLRGKPCSIATMNVCNAVLEFALAAQQDSSELTTRAKNPVVNFLPER